MKYTALTPIKFNGERYAENAPIELNDKQAKPLLEAGAVEPAKPAARAPKLDEK